MKKLAVHYCGWGEDWPLGMLADDGRVLLFEYSPQALAQGLELSPLHLKLRAAAYGGFPGFQLGLPGLIAESLPDGWGLMLMDRLFRRQGMREPGSLDRLAFIGERAMGALRFEPEGLAGEPQPDWSLLALAQESERVLAGAAEAALRELALTGGSPQGARPKALVQYSTTTASALPKAERALLVEPADGSGKTHPRQAPSYGESAIAMSRQAMSRLLRRRATLPMQPLMASSARSRKRSASTRPRALTRCRVSSACIAAPGR